MITMLRSAALAALVSVVAVPAAVAHVVLANREAPAGSYYQAVFLVPHGCEGGAATVGLRVEIPEGIVTAKPMPKPGWTVEIAREALAEAVRVESRTVDQRVKAVTWRGGPLPDDEFDSFTVMVRLPERAGPLYFPAVQQCEGGAETTWTEMPPPGGTARDVRHPPPVVVLTPAAPAR